MQKYLERVSTNWTEYFAEKKTVDILFFLDNKFILGDSVLLDFGLTSTQTERQCVLKSGKMKQHRLKFQEVDPDTGKLEARFRTRSRQLSTSTHDDRLNIFFVIQTSTTEMP